MKELGYHIFAILYRIFCIFKLDEKRVFLIMTHDAGGTGNVAVMRDYMANKGDYSFYSLVRGDTHFGKSFAKAFRFFFISSYHLARSKYVIMDNMFLPYAFIKPKKGVKIIQLWHGTGVIKKIGSDANEGRLKDLEIKANAKTTHLIVSSETTKRIYSGSFSMPDDKVFITGMPRTDCLFKGDDYIDEQKEMFYKDYPDLRNKKIILYAPTFRDKDVDHPKLMLDVKKVASELPDGYVLGIRLHPFVAKTFNEQHKDGIEGVVDFSSYGSLNTLLFASDILISDYSSIVFEYAALKRPMIFHAPDLKEFSDSGRGFYHDYESYVPGAVTFDEEGVINKIREVSNVSIDEYDSMYHLDEFVDDTYKYKDSNSAKRVYDLMMK